MLRPLLIMAVLTALVTMPVLYGLYVVSLRLALLAR
jgi:hypothetical protein